ncbi:MAG TPA: hypothetical protein VK536_10225 [Candidatus Limnocylindrales bacterium]|nr:hypothetical protein [Candidatus Limnocylindrales bacterium]
MKKTRTIFDVMREYLDEFEQASEGIFDGNLEMPSWDVEAHSLEPLFNVYVRSDEVIVTVDLPCVDPAKIRISEVGSKLLEIDAVMKVKVNFRDLGVTHRKGEFSSLQCRVPIPVPVEAALAEAHFLRGILQVVLPRKRGRPIKVE